MNNEKRISIKKRQKKCKFLAEELKKNICTIEKLEWTWSKEVRRLKETHERVCSW